jgi:hypothetical protein
MKLTPQTNKAKNSPPTTSKIVHIDVATLPSLSMSSVIAANVSICVRAGLPKPRAVPDTERIKDTKTLDYASTPLDANTLLAVVGS